MTDQPSPEMNSEPAIRAFQARIIESAVSKLGRPLKSNEETFITSRLGFIALELIGDTVEAASPEELLDYLNSEG